MIYRPFFVLFAMATMALCGIAKAEEPKEIKTEKNKAVIIANFLSVPNNCGTNPGPVPLPGLREKPSHGIVGLQIVVADVAASDACPARKIPAIVLFYTPSTDFVGKDSVQVEFVSSGTNNPGASFLITVQDSSGK